MAMSDLREAYSSVATLAAVVTLGAVAFCGAAVPAGAAQPPPAGLSGEWVLNAEESDDPRAMLRKQIRSRAGSAAGGPGGQGSGLRGGALARGAAARGSGGGASGGAVAGALARAAGRPTGRDASGAREVGGARGRGPGAGNDQDADAAAEELTIRIVDGGVRITDAVGWSRVLRTDREWREAELGGEYQAFWKKAKLVTKVRGRERAAVQQEYSLNKKGQLVVATTIQTAGDMPSLSFKRVYDRLEDG